MSAAQRTAPEDVTTVACVGAGVIGGGWAAYFLSRGFDVRAHDPAPDGRERLRAVIDAAWPALVDVGLAQGASRDRLTFCEELADAVGPAQFVQESAPETLHVKRELLAAIDEVTPEHVVVGSSTSGYGMSEMDTDVAHPERFVVGHPFNPPYLIPLVEVVGSPRTDPDVVEWAARFYTRAGKSVIALDRELPGFVANRLQEALWREALHMVANGEATVEQIDRAIVDGPGPRWAFHGPMLTFHLAGGPQGMAHMLEHFGPSLLAPWTRLAAPELTDGLRADVIAGCEREAEGWGFAELVAERDAKLVAVLRATGRLP